MNTPYDPDLALDVLIEKLENMRANPDASSSDRALQMVTEETETASDAADALEEQGQGQKVGEVYKKLAHAWRLAAEMLPANKQTYFRDFADYWQQCAHDASKLADRTKELAQKAGREPEHQWSPGTTRFEAIGGRRDPLKAIGQAPLRPSTAIGQRPAAPDRPRSPGTTQYRPIGGRQQPLRAIDQAPRDPTAAGRLAPPTTAPHRAWRLGTTQSRPLGGRQQPFSLLGRGTVDWQSLVGPQGLKNGASLQGGTAMANSGLLRRLGAKLKDW